MMAVDDATQWYQKKEGDPDTGFISATDAIAAITQTYTDFEATTITAGTGLTGGGDLSANRTLSVDTGGIDTAQLADGAVSAAKLDAEANILPSFGSVTSSMILAAYSTATSTTQTWSSALLDRCYFWPFYVQQSISVDRVAIEVTTGGDGAFRIGIYRANGTDGKASTLVKDFNTVSAASAGVKTIDDTCTLTRGWHYYAIAFQSGPISSAPVLRSRIPQTLALVRDLGLSGTSGNIGSSQTGVSSGLPATANPINSSYATYPAAFYVRSS